MAAGTMVVSGTMVAAPARMANRQPCWLGTPEVYFAKNIDNSRLVRVADPKRSREMRMLLGAFCCLFLLTMTYAWQHFSAIEYGYKIEGLKSQRDGLIEMNRAFRLEEASLRDPGRIDTLAKRMGLQPPDVGQVMRMDASTPEAGAPQLARVTAVSVISAR